MLADIKEKHDEEILDEALRTTEAIRGELDKSLETLRRTLNAVSPMAVEPENHQGRPLVHLSDPVKPS
jgi:predicted ATPase